LHGARRSRNVAFVALVTRNDTYELDAQSLARAQLTPEGFLRLDSWIYRSGPQVYRRADGTERIEYRDPDLVFQPEILRRHALLPIVQLHPAEDVTPNNAQRHVRGAVGQDVRRDGERARTSIIVYDAELIEAVRSRRLTHLSVGYTCQLDETPGVDPQGRRYDARQLDWRPNHVAFVELGRAGNTFARVDRRDHADLVVGDNHTTTTRGSIMAMTEEEKKRLEAAEAAAAKEKARADAAEAAAAKEKSRADLAENDLLSTQRAERDARQRADAAEAAGKLAAGKTREGVRARLALDRIASIACPNLYEAPRGADGRQDSAAACPADAMDDRAVMVAVIKRVDGVDVPAERGEEYVRGAYEMAARRVNAQRADYARLDQGLLLPEQPQNQPPQSGDQRQDNADPYDAMMSRMHAASIYQARANNGANNGN
jgi:hypothetical protein